MNRDDTKRREGGHVHLNVIVVRSPLPLLIKEVLIIGKVVVGPAPGLACLSVCGRIGEEYFSIVSIEELLTSS